MKILLPFVLGLCFIVMGHGLFAQTPEMEDGYLKRRCAAYRDVVEMFRADVEQLDSESTVSVERAEDAIVSFTLMEKFQRTLDSECS